MTPSFFVDTNVFAYAAVDPNSERRSACIRVLESVAGGNLGFASTAVIVELWNLELSGRIGEVPGLTEAAAELMGSLLPVTGITTDHAFALAGTRLGSMDRMHVATCVEHGLDAIVSSDRGFDEAPEVRRIDPLDAEALGTIGVTPG